MEGYLFVVVLKVLDVLAVLGGNGCFVFAVLAKDIGECVELRNLVIFRSVLEVLELHGELLVEDFQLQDAHPELDSVLVVTVGSELGLATGIGLGWLDVHAN